MPLAESRLLPLVTLANPRDKHTAWGATVPNKYGDYIYASFPPAGFFVPALLARTQLQLTGLPPTLASMVASNCMLGLIAALLLSRLTCRVAIASGVDATGAAIAGTLAASVLLFSR
ncbi:hypothetical protein [Caballeronia calidae]|uniref:hypothetical protein n=1 Tax=Caballeronia calidae TaxID=1777139 RepID=UPI0012FDD690|nr:hypothetical protein [Caballeronia calidae]